MNRGSGKTVLYKMPVCLHICIFIVQKSKQLYIELNQFITVKVTVVKVKLASSIQLNSNVRINSSVRLL